MKKRGAFAKPLPPKTLGMSRSALQRTGSDPEAKNQ